MHTEIIEKVPLVNVLSKLKDAVVIVDKLNRIIYLNDTASRLYEITGQQANGRKLLEVLRERFELKSNQDALFETGTQTPHDRITQLIKKSGEEIWVKISISALPKGSGELLGYLILTHDITEQKEQQEESKYHLALKAEADLAAKKSLSEVQTFFESVEDPFFLLDSELKFTYINKSAEKVFGKNREEILGRPITAIIPAIKKSSLYRRLCEEETNVNFKEFLRPLGIWAEYTLHSWENGGKRNVGVYFRDVSESVQLEQKLYESEEKYRQLVSSINEPFFALDTTLRITYWNEKAEELTGIKAKSAIGKSIYQVLPQVSGESKDNIYYEALAEGKPKSFTLDLKIGNEDRIFETYIYPSVKGLTVLCKDVTEGRQMAIRLKKYNEQLQQIVEERTKALRGAERLAAIGQTAGMVGHDIRNPLQSILNEVYLAKVEAANVNQKKLQSALTESITNIENDVRYINKIVQDLQDYARPLNPIIQTIKLETVVEEVVFGKEYPENVKISVNIEPKAKTISSDADMLRRIIDNLTTNAVQAMPSGGTLTVQAHKMSNQTVITVEDTGVGIPKEAEKKLFTPLFTTKSKGQGFGLPVVKRLTEALGGKVSFESKEGRGTKFRIQLPSRPLK